MVAQIPGHVCFTQPGQTIQNQFSISPVINTLSYPKLTLQRRAEGHYAEVNLERERETRASSSTLEFLKWTDGRQRQIVNELRNVVDDNVEGIAFGRIVLHPSGRFPEICRTYASR